MYLNHLWITIISFCFTALVGLTDFVTGASISFSLFYLISIYFATWYGNLYIGLGTSIFSTVVWNFVDILLGRQELAQPLIIFLWAWVSRLAFFVIVNFLLSKNKYLIQREKDLARTDALTKAMNRRAFFELAEMEIERSSRYKHPITFAYIDIDKFKFINDRLGHSVGDKLLCLVVKKTKEQLRNVDVVARLGGDEFIIILLETNADSAQKVLSRIQIILLEAMQDQNWDVTFSIGVLTCIATYPSVPEIVSLGDNLMYSVKKNGKNAITYSTI